MRLTTAKLRFLNKKVRVKIPQRDRKGKVIPNQYTPVTGICTFVGYNSALETKQITVDRFPISIGSYNEIQLIEE